MLCVIGVTSLAQETYSSSHGSLDTSIHISGGVSKAFLNLINSIGDFGFESGFISISWDLDIFELFKVIFNFSSLFLGNFLDSFFEGGEKLFDRGFSVSVATRVNSVEWITYIEIVYYSRGS